MNDNQKKLVFKGTGVLLGIAFVFSMATFVVPKVLITASNASFSQKVSTKNSFLMGEVIAAKANGVDKCKISAFVLDADGKGVAGKKVKVTGLNTFEATTNDSGRATFEFTSDVTGQYEIIGSVDGVKMAKTLIVTFR